MRRIAAFLFAALIGVPAMAQDAYPCRPITMISPYTPGGASDFLARTLASLAREEFDEAAAVDVELEPGQMVMFDVYTIHGAAHSRGAIPRAGYALRFMPASSHFDHDGAERRSEPGYAHNTRALMLARGMDRSGRNEFTRGHPAAT